MPSCNVMTSNGQCTLTAYTASSIECMCDICSSSSSRRALSSSSSLAATQISAMTLFVFNEYSTTISESTSIDWYRTVKNTIIIILAFIIVWSSVIAVVPLKTYAHRTIKTTSKRLRTVSRRLSQRLNLSAVMPDIDGDTTSPEQTIRDYINKYLPIIYRDDVSILSRIVTQLRRKHIYYDFFTNDDKGKDISIRFLTAFKILTHISVRPIFLITNTNINTTTTITSASCFSWPCCLISSSPTMMVLAIPIRINSHA